MRVSIGNFPAHAKAVLRVYYYQHLCDCVEDLSYALRIPMSYVPRYVGSIPGLLTTGKQYKGQTEAIEEEKRD